MRNHLSSWNRSEKNFYRRGFKTKKEEKSELKVQPWPDNALRHSFASHHLAHHRNADDLALTLGHQGTNLIFRHYRALVDAEQAAAYWDVFPKEKS